MFEGTINQAFVKEEYPLKRKGGHQADTKTKLIVKYTVTDTSVHDSKVLQGNWMNRTKVRSSMLIVHIREKKKW